MTVKAYEEDSPPPAVVMMWTGSVANIPSGWALCDGNNGTPDMTNRMVKGNSSMTTAPGNAGGQNSVTLTEANLPPHNHSASSSTAGSHRHTVSYGFSPEDYDLGANKVNPNGTGDHPVVQDGAHSHSISVSNSGGSSSVENRPAYYSVAFITKL